MSHQHQANSMTNWNNNQGTCASPSERSYAHLCVVVVTFTDGKDLCLSEISHTFVCKIKIKL